MLRIFSVIALAAMFLVLFVGSVSAQESTPEAVECSLPEGIQFRIFAVRGVVEEDKDAVIDVQFRNPFGNDCAVEGELQLTVPENILVYGVNKALSGRAGTVNASILDLQPTEEAGFLLAFKGLDVGEFTVTLEGSYRPAGSSERLKHLVAYQNITVTGVSGDTNNITVPPEDLPDDTVTPVPATTSQSPATPLSSSEDALPLWGIILLIFLGVVVLLFLIIVLGRVLL